MALYKFIEESETKTFSFTADEGTKKERHIVVSLVQVDKSKGHWGPAIKCDQGGAFVKITK